ncbi:hypothetical protein DPMN_095002 [Dreissena polymorpha]|uniref:Uncharacterized protein n=1 Tax=Dreissena polymorpha TaxID=45954 RepID=A0A9D4L8F8_DREPO|nr:hypothetical protein DPMN_095002 [Dreissena polymorpha]
MCSFPTLRSRLPVTRRLPVSRGLFWFDTGCIQTFSLFSLVGKVVHTDAISNNQHPVIQILGVTEELPGVGNTSHVELKSCKVRCKTGMGSTSNVELKSCKVICKTGVGRTSHGELKSCKVRS